MKKYIIDASTYDVEGNQIITYIEHAEAKDGSIEENFNTVKNLQQAEETLLSQPTTGVMVTRVSIVQVKIINGKEIELGRIDSEVTAIYSLYKHLQKIDQYNPDNLPW